MSYFSIALGETNEGEELDDDDDDDDDDGKNGRKKEA